MFWSVLLLWVAEDCRWETCNRTLGSHPLQELRTTIRSKKHKTISIYVMVQFGDRGGGQATSSARKETQCPYHGPYLNSLLSKMSDHNFAIAVIVNCIPWDQVKKHMAADT